MSVLEIVSVVFVLFVILLAFKLVIDSFDDELLKFYWQYSEKGYETEIKIFRAIDILLQKKMAARLEQYRKDPRL